MTSRQLILVHSTIYAVFAAALLLFPDQMWPLRARHHRRQCPIPVATQQHLPQRNRHPRFLVLRPRRQQPHTAKVARRSHQHKSGGRCDHPVCLFHRHLHRAWLVGSRLLRVPGRLACAPSEAAGSTRSLLLSRRHDSAIPSILYTFNPTTHTDTQEHKTHMDSISRKTTETVPTKQLSPSTVIGQLL